MDKLNTSKKLLAATVATMAMSGAASAAIVDGIVSAGEYAGGTTLNLGFADDQGKTANPIQGTFSFITEGSYIFAALSAPTNFVDNVYGAPSLIAGSGWVGLDSNVGGSTTTTSGGKKKKDKKKGKKKGGSGHTFDQLVGSDKLFFDLNTINGRESIEFDYLTKDHVSEISEGSSFIQELATSLEYNLTHGCGDTTDSPDFSASGLDAGCTEVLTYEWKMEASLFANFSAADLIDPTMHASPSKTGDHNFNPDCKDNNGTFANCPTVPGNPPVSVSEPGTFGVFLAGLLGLGWSRRRARLKQQ